MLRLIKERLGTYVGQKMQCAQTIMAGVVMPIFEKDGEVFLVLTKRSEKVRFHKSEISFPGGMYEESDRDIMDTALRECCEEIGVSPGDVEIIGRIDDVYTVTGFVITPYVGVVPYPYEFCANPDEVAYIISLPYRHLTEQNPVYEAIRLGDKTHHAPALYSNGDRIWGATCKMLLKLKSIVDEEI
jgi:8-oxo-dGTP pyrophosphatase MutT (NUDIX family)